jgi:hypothetical protein
VTFKDNRNGTATFSGTPAGGSAGSYQVTVTASNGIGPSVHRTFTITVSYLQGYVLAASDGGVFAFGHVGFHGSMGNRHLNKPIVGIASTPSGGGYWMVASDGGVFAFGNAKFYGSMGNRHLNKPIVGIAATTSGNGYWLVASDGGLFAYGDATFYGSMGAHRLNKPVVGMSPTQNGKGYWLVASDGGLFAFGDAGFHGSTGALKIAAPVVAMAVDHSTGGYWLIATDGGVFAFDAPFMGRPKSASRVMGATSSSGVGYLLSAANGAVFPEGKVSYFGSLAGKKLNAPIIGMASPGGS